MFNSISSTHRGHPGEINNFAFLQHHKNRIRPDIKITEICLVIRELMKRIAKYIEVDHIIKIPYNSNDTKIRLPEAIVLSENEFIKIAPRSNGNKFENDNNLEEVIQLFENNSDYKILTFPDSKSNRSEDDKKNEKFDNDKIEVKSSNVIKLDTQFKRNNKRLDIIRDNDSLADKKTKDNTISDKSSIMKRSNATSPLVIRLDGFQALSLEPKGLYNPSVYCFMNTCLQCLVSIPELNYYFSSMTYNKEKLSKKSPTACNALKEFIDNYDVSSGSLKAPASLYKVCHSFLEPNQQHDCQEFLRRFLSKIQEELNINKKYTFPEKTSYDKIWEMYRAYNPSFIDTLFSGLMRSSVICNKCGYKSDTYDPFLDLSVPIKRKPVETLENCIENYFSKEFIDCEYKCSSCKKKTSISKKLEIVLSPPILTIHFKRFEDLHHKFNGAIEFSEKLDLLTFTGKEVYASLNYELFAVGVHLGRSIFSGHYIAYAKRDGKWYNLNDSSVFRAGLEEALSNSAYILFYRRIN